jgi:hypothetical protein
VDVLLGHVDANHSSPGGRGDVATSSAEPTSDIKHPIGWPECELLDEVSGGWSAADMELVDRSKRCNGWRLTERAQPMFDPFPQSSERIVVGKVLIPAVLGAHPANIPPAGNRIWPVVYED